VKKSNKIEVLTPNFENWTYMLPGDKPVRARIDMKWAK